MEIRGRKLKQEQKLLLHAWIGGMHGADEFFSLDLR